MSQRKEFIVLATQPAHNVRALCRAFAISPKTGYKWLARDAAEGASGLQARSRHPHQLPQRTPDALEQAILQLRAAPPAWGGRKLPARLLMDNGAPGAARPFTPLTVWCIRLGIALSHARPAHPQTLGKDDRFHRPLKAERRHQRLFLDLAHGQQHFDRWRALYNLARPHEALAMAVPASRYQSSPRGFPERLPPIE